MPARTLLLALALLAPSLMNGQGTEVDIPDSGLKLAIQKALGVSSRILTASDMEALTHLDAEERSIQDLSGLEFATNLQVLELGDNNLTDISPLATLTQLTVLSAYGNKIADVSPLSNLTALTTLNLWETTKLSTWNPCAG